MSKFWGLMALVVGGIIVADLVIHPEGVAALGHAGNTSVGLLSSALLGDTGGPDRSGKNRKR